MISRPAHRMGRADSMSKRRPAERRQAHLFVCPPLAAAAAAAAAANPRSPASPIQAAQSRPKQGSRAGSLDCRASEPGRAIISHIWLQAARLKQPPHLSACLPLQNLADPSWPNPAQVKAGGHFACPLDWSSACATRPARRQRHLAPLAPSGRRAPGHLSLEGEMEMEMKMRVALEVASSNQLACHSNLLSSRVGLICKQAARLLHLRSSAQQLRLQSRCLWRSRQLSGEAEGAEVALWRADQREAVCLLINYEWLAASPKPRLVPNLASLPVRPIWPHGCGRSCVAGERADAKPKLAPLQWD